MLKVVLDANLFISSVICSQGQPAKILDLVRSNKIQLIISDEILSEIKKVLFYPRIKKRHKKNAAQIEEFIESISGFAELINPKIKLTVIKDDPDDNKYIECSITGKADYIISGDHHLKDLKSYQGIKILSPAEFLKNYKIRSK
jgi:putative PIN family toxin of toxin-antitoxin system